LKTRWFWLVGFALVYVGLRVFWLTCDSGVPSTWEYGFHTTDEGYYLCGGKEMLLWGSFVDLVRQEALNYCYSYGTHWLSYLAHLCFGLSTWTWRIPFSLLYATGWILMFLFVAKRSGGPFAFATCLAASSVPLVLTYERCASNDATIAALLATAYALAAGKGVWRIFAAALVASAIGTVKPAVWVLSPIVLSSLLEERKTRSRWLDAVVFLGAVAVFAFVWRFASELSVACVAKANGLSAGQVLARVNATYGLPSIWDFGQNFRALASFPRDPTVLTMGPTIILVSVVPAAMLLTNLIRRKWSHRLLLYAAVPLYAYALNVINSMYTHYFLPLIVLLPAIATAIREDGVDLSDEKGDKKWLGSMLALAAVTFAALLAYIVLNDFKPCDVMEFYSPIQNLPRSNPWRVTWPFLAVGTPAMVLLVTMFRGLRAFCRESWIWAVVFFLILSIALAAFPGAVLAPILRVPESTFYWPLAVNLAIGCLFALLLFSRPSVLSRPAVAAGIVFLPIVAAYALLPTWRSAAVELLTQRTHYDAALADGLKAVLPKNAVLVGERSDQALMSLPIRGVSTFLSASNPIPYVERIRTEEPDAPIYALIDPDCPYNLQHFRKHEKEFRLEHIRTFRVPSTYSGHLGDVHLCRVHDLRRDAK